MTSKKKKKDVRPECQKKLNDGVKMQQESYYTLKL